MAAMSKEEMVKAGVWANEANLMDIGRVFYVDVAVTAATLDANTRTGKAVVVPAATVVQGTAPTYKIRNIILVGGGTNFGAGGDCTVGLTDGTTTWTTIANADLEAAPAASLPWGNAKVPMLTGTSNTASVAGAQIDFRYASGTAAHTTGSITFSVGLERMT